MCNFEGKSVYYHPQPLQLHFGLPGSYCRAEAEVLIFKPTKILYHNGDASRCNILYISIAGNYYTCILQVAS